MTTSRFLALFAALALLLTVSTTVLAQQTRPHAFTGSAMMGDEIAAEGTLVTAYIDGIFGGAAGVRADGSYVLKVNPPSGVSYSGKVVTFTVGILRANQSAEWMEGDVSLLDLTTGRVNRPSEEVFADLVTAGILIVVWHFDNATKEWTFYDPRPELARAVDLTEVTGGDHVWIRVRGDQRFQGEMLTTGWNLSTLKVR